MTITAAELERNFSKYLSLLSAEDIFITKNGKIIAKLSDPNISAVDKLSGLLSGHIPNDYGKNELRAERLSKYKI